jgi:hypothetical protein
VRTNVSSCVIQGGLLDQSNARADTAAAQRTHQSQSRQQQLVKQQAAALESHGFRLPTLIVLSAAPEAQQPSRRRCSSAPRPAKQRWQWSREKRGNHLLESNENPRIRVNSITKKMLAYRTRFTCSLVFFTLTIFNGVLLHVPVNSFFTLV